MEIDNLIKIVFKHMNDYPFISCDLAGALYLSKVPNVVLNKKRKIKFWEDNTKIIGNTSLEVAQEKGLIYIDKFFDDLLNNYFGLFINGITTSSFHGLLYFFKNLDTDEKLISDIKLHLK